MYDLEWSKYPPLSGSLFPAPLHLSKQIQLHPFSLKMKMFKRIKDLGFVLYLGLFYQKAVAAG